MVFNLQPIAKPRSVETEEKWSLDPEPLTFKETRNLLKKKNIEAFLFVARDDPEGVTRVHEQTPSTPGGDRFR